MTTGEQHLPYFELRDAFSSDECAICRLVRKHTARHFAYLLYECVNDIAFRRSLDESGGLCTVHAKQLLEQRDVLATVLMHQSLLRQATGELEGPHLSNSRRRSRCPICAYADTEENRALETLLNFAGSDEQFADAFKQSFGLCIPHLRACVRRYPKSIPPWLVPFHQEKIRALEKDADDYVRWCNASIPCAEKRPFSDEDIARLHRRIIARLYGSK